MGEASVLEGMIRQALDNAGVEYTREPEPERLDFYLPQFGVFIEVKAFHSDRISEQMSRAPNVIAVQGEGAAKFIWALISTIPLALAEAKKNEHHQL